MADVLVIQSYRRVDVPLWIHRCLASVERWAAQRGYAYQFVGDELFDLIPPAYLARTRHHVQLVTDLGRLLLVRDALAHGHRRVIWLDADVLVFAPSRFELPDVRDFYLCRELWLELADRTITISRRVNNCACAFAHGNSFLEFYIAACEQLVRDTAGALGPLLVGTQFLTALDRVLPLPQFEQVALYSPQVVRELALGGGPCVDALARASSPPAAAANFCASFRGRRFPRLDGPAFELDDDLFLRAVDALLGDASP